jgi:regulator of sirC expression with transglutaminase-like and TPR domain
VIDAGVRRAFLNAATSADDGDLPRAALLLGRLEYHTLDVGLYLGRLTRLGALLTARLERLGPMPDPHAQLSAINTLLFEEEGFTGNVARYEDPRNSFLSDVLERRTGIPISLAVVYLEVGRRAGMFLEGINFPGHFLVRYRPGTRDPEGPRELIVDPFHQGALLSESDCRQLLRKHLGDDAAFDRRLLATAGKRQILIRMLHNLKRLYVSMRSFPQARAAVDLLLGLDPLNANELRDRGLLSYHLQDFQAALRDLESYFRAAPKVPTDADEEQRQEHEQVWEHLKTLRRRVAGLN